ncbi:YdbL family protein [Dongia rigui]|uniref:YdbL family protein n=1 Tax=Dongia rigui TaxID=940149 RepID=A0ABU5DV23_9PROT|nr:YdbL family protein [Dongia rigui]MDY0871166.1 YdbL family protein [Dongia rigui]
MRNILRNLMVALLLVGSLGATSLPAHADPLDDARAAGQIGERADGYVALVDAGAPANVKQLVDEVNAKRRAAYQKIAAEKSVPTEQIAAIAAEKIIREILTPGMYYMDASGSWKQK